MPDGDDVTQVVSPDQPHFLEGAPWIRVVPLRTPTLPPATHTNCYIIGDAAAATVIDPASPYSDEQTRLVQFVRTHNILVREIVLTHHHVDHVSGASELAAATGAGIAAHAETAARLRGRIAVSRILDEGERVGELVARFTPGHAPGHLCFVDAAARAIVVGDMLASVGTIIIEPGDGGDMGLYLASLARLRAEVDAGATRLLPAHGPPIVDGGARIDFYVAHRLEREARVLAALGATPATLEELVPAAYPDVSPAIYGLAARSLLAHLFKLEREGRAMRSDERWARGAIRD
jgi:glyoxylase-like metal-dependent hydrolase (beta-lactamase superfamily II)